MVERNVIKKNSWKNLIMNFIDWIMDKSADGVEFVIGVANNVKKL